MKSFYRQSYPQCGQFYKRSTIVIYSSRVVLEAKFMSKQLSSCNGDFKLQIGLAAGSIPINGKKISVGKDERGKMLRNDERTKKLQKRKSRMYQK